MTNTMENAACPAAWDTNTPCANTDGDGHDGKCADSTGREWSRTESWFTPEAAPVDGDDLEWL